MKQNAKVDKDGIRLAPTVANVSKPSKLPVVVQQVGFAVEKDTNLDREESTSKDYQPKAKDISKTDKTSMRLKNIIVGTLMLLCSVAVLLPYIFGSANYSVNLGFQFSLGNHNVFLTLFEAVKDSIDLANAGAGGLIGEVWLSAVPSIILLIGLIAVAKNVLSALAAVIFSREPKSYAGGALFYLFVTLVLLAINLVGLESIGVAKIDFVSDIINNFRTSELFTICVFALGYALLSAIITKINPKNYGY